MQIDTLRHYEVTDILPSRYTSRNKCHVYKRWSEQACISVEGCFVDRAMVDRAIMSVPLAAAIAYSPIAARTVIVSIRGNLDNKRPGDEDAAMEGMTPDLKDLVQRLKWSHVNQLEMLGFYAGAVGIAVAVKMPPKILVRLTSWYLKSRIAYAMAYAAPQVANGALRTASFLSALTSCCLIYLTAAQISVSVT